MDLRLLIPVILFAAIFAGLAFFMGWLEPVFSFVSFFGIFETIILLAFFAGLCWVAFTYRGFVQLLALGGIGILLFIFVVYPVFFDALNFLTFIRLGVFGVVMLFLILVLTPPVDVELFFLIPLKKLGVPLWLGEVVVLSVAMLLFSFLSVIFPFAWGLLFGSWAIEPFWLGAMVFVSTFVLLIGDKVIDNI